ncbi:head GIN domain-containing protein [Formosa haliotis]|uniref:head GIN domain-containing protein n=1 Tax=Formosa haliotis TaxID=1555194 RepID=UPI000826D0F7|nr:head GIN domain-containing protein [Formosa haliotis]
MKNIIYIVFVLIVMSCDNDTANDCFRTSGTTISKAIAVESFETILVNRNIELILKQGPEISVIIETGENLMNDVEVHVVDGELQLTDNNTCNLFRDYDPTRITVTTPTVTSIRSSTQFDVQSEGVLVLDRLTLTSEDFNDSDSFNVGDFNMHINVQDLNVVSNNISMFYISGITEHLTVGFYAGAGRFEGANLIANTVNVYHRGSNDIIVNPQISLKGELVSTGNLISKNKPETVEVEAKYKGDLYFED